jgi:hypothetical protein
MDIRQQVESRDIRLSIPSEERKYIRGHTKSLKPNKLVPIASSDKYGFGGSSTDIAMWAAVAAIAISCATYIGYKFRIVMKNRRANNK